jgi:iron complex outermembrane receptor protein
MAATLSLPPTLCAQSAGATKAPDKKEDVVVLSAFEVPSTRTYRYQVAEATSGGRIGVSLMDTPASISVVTSELLQDVGAVRLLDAVKYTSGVTEGITPNGLERVTIRGFQSDFTVTDGFRTSAGQMNTDPALVERVEVMKGPNAILQPQGTPGGTVNAVTKSPSFKAGGTATVQVGMFDANRASLDYNGVLVRNKAAYRIILSGQDAEGWWDSSFTQSWLVAPSLLLQLSDATRLTVKTLMSDFKVATYGGIPLDPSVGTDDKAITFKGVNRRSNPRGEQEVRRDIRQEIGVFLTSRATDRLSVRLAGRFLNLLTDAYGTNPALAAGGAVNPLTGKWVGGTVFGPAPTFTPSPAPAVNPVALRSGGDTITPNHFFNVQNDYSYELQLGAVKSTTTGGVAYADLSQEVRVRTGTRGTLDITNTRAAQDTPTTFGPFNGWDLVTAREQQAYVQEQLSMLNNNLILSGGLSGITAQRKRDRLLNTPRVTEIIPNSSKGSYNAGVIYKPTANISLYYGHSSNAVLTGDYTGTAAGTAPRFAEGIQDEVGAKAAFAENRITVSAAYFKLKQTQFGVDNPANYTSPPPVPRLPFMFFDRIGKGWEVNVVAAVTKSLNVIGNFYSVKNRDPNGIPFQAAADQSGAVYLRYDVMEGPMKGFGFSIGADYLGKRPGLQASGFTAASTPTKLIPIQPSFYVPARTLTNVGLFYKAARWEVQCNIDNALDTEYVTGTFTRNGVWVGTPINVKLAFTRKF